jgi:hypothetical protein
VPPARRGRVLRSRVSNAGCVRNLPRQPVCHAPTGLLDPPSEAGGSVRRGPVDPTGRLRGFGPHCAARKTAARCTTLGSLAPRSHPGLREVVLLCMMSQ